MRHSASAVLANTMEIKEWVLNNFKLKDHSNENIVFIIDSFTKKAFLSRKPVLGGSLTAAGFK